MKPFGVASTAWKTNCGEDLDGIEQNRQVAGGFADAAAGRMATVRVCSAESMALQKFGAR